MMRICLGVSALLWAAGALAQAGFPNVPRTPGELLTPGPQGFASDGRGAIIAFHGGLLYTVPEHPSSAAGSSLQIKIWDISSETLIRQPRLVENLGVGPMNMQAHGYVFYDNRLQLGGGDGWLFERTGYQQYQRRNWQAGWQNVVFERGLLIPGWNFAFHNGGFDVFGNWFYRLDDVPFGIGRRTDPNSVIPTEIWASWDHLAVSAGVKGLPLVFGDLLLIASEEQTLSGLAIYDLKPTFRNRGTPPTLLSTFKQGATGGYWPELWGQGDRLYVFFPRRNDNHRGWQIVDVSDPAAPALVSDVTQPQNGLMYVQFQDQYAFSGPFKIDMLNPDAPALTLAGNQPGFYADTTQFALPLGNLLVTGGLGTLENQAWRIWAHQAEPDTRGPSVGYHRPRPNQTDWPLQAPLSFLIHETLRSETLINGQTVIVRPVGGSAINAVLNFSSGQQLNVVPTAPLLADTQYEVVFPAGGIQDAAGNGIGAYSFRFSTGGSVSGNLAPAISALNANPYPASPQQAVNFSGSASDPEGGALEYRYSYGDGSVREWSAQTTASHSYASAGRYNVLLQVRDSQGAITSRALRLTVTQAPSGARPQHSAALALSADGSTLWAVNPDASTLARVRVTDGVLTGEFPVGPDPRGVGIDAQGRVWVSCHDGDRIDILDPLSGAVQQSIDTGYGSAPLGMVFDATRQRAYVSLSGAGRVLRIEQATLAQTAVNTGPHPHALALSGDGNRLLVTRFISPASHGEVYDIATGSMSLTRTLILPFRSVPYEHSADGRGVPNYLAGIAIEPAGTRAWVSAKKDNITRGLQYFDGRHELDPDNTVRAQLIAIDLQTQRQDDARTRDLDNSDSPGGIAFSPLGDYLFVALQGHDEVLVLDTLKLAVDPQQQGIVGRYPVGAAPQSLLTGGNTPMLWTQNFLDRDLARHALDPFLRGNGGLTAPQRIVTSTQEALSATELLGKRIFYRSKDPRMSLEGYLSCATCHVDGSSDGRVWDFSGRGEGLRNNIDLRGRRGIGHGAVHWTANFDEIQDFENDIRAFFGGTGFMSPQDFLATQNPLGPLKAGRSAELDALAAYVASLNTASIPRSPWRQGNGALTAAAVRGASIFQGQGCASCHDPAQGYRDGQRHDVGTLRATSGQRIGGPLDGIDTPTLLGMWDNPPYLHDGAADTLEAVFSTSGGPRYPAESATLSNGASAVTQYIDLNAGNSSFGGFVELDGAGERVIFSSVDGGTGGSGRIELRIGLWRDNGSFELDVVVNGQVHPLTITALGAHTGWRTAAVDDVQLSAGSSNSIEIRARSGGWPPLGLDQITVSRPQERALAAPHRRVLGLSGSARADLVAFLRELDGRDPNGQLPVGLDPVFADGFEAGR